MCGIAGLLRPTSNTTLDDSPVTRMVDHLRHRGPDGFGIASTSNGAHVTLGHTRLAIIDLSASGRQPMVDAEQQRWITFNGEIYNYRELRQQLGDAGPWFSTSDTEVVLRAYARWGRDCLEHLRGMFAFAIWDARRAELFLARDRLGIKPLYYTTTPQGHFMFASEVRALLASGLVPRQLDPAGVADYLTYQSVSAPRTLVDSVRSLPPASWLVVDADAHITQGTYWDLLVEQDNTCPVDPLSCRRRLRELLEDSINHHLVSDVPVGAFLSGGIDSSAVVGLMRAAGSVPRTFSVGFAETAYDESNYARDVAQHFATEHTQILLRERDLLDQLPEALSAMDQPTGDGVNTYVISRAVRETGIKVALSGLGGDELFGGYPSFARLERSATWLRAWGHAPSPLRALAARGVRAVGGATIGASKAALMVASDGQFASIYPFTRQVLSPVQRQALLVEDQSSRDPYQTLLQDKLDSRRVGTFTAVSYAEARTYMHDVLLRDTDQMSMSRALEVRVPFLDHPLVEYVMGLPDTLKRSNGTPKRLLVEALDGALPEHIVHRRKQGFTLPFDPWLRGPLRGFCEDRLDPDRVRQRGMFSPEAVSALWNAFTNSQPGVNWSRPWLLVVLEDWLNRNGF